MDLGLTYQSRPERPIASVAMMRVLAILFLGLLVALPLPVLAKGKLTAPEALARVQSDQVTLIDVRSISEWRETGIPVGAKAVTIHNPQGMEGFLTEVLAVVQSDKSRPIALICAAGMRSSRAHRYLEKQGFTSVYDVSEGMLGRFPYPGWLKRGLPTEPCTSC